MTDIVNIGLSVDSREVNEGKNALKDFGNQANNTETATSKLSTVMKVGLAAAATAVGAAFISSIKANREFEKSISELSAITGATGKDLQFYSEQAMQMGASSVYGASEVATAFKLVASAKPDLLDSKEALAQVTQEVLTLATASGMELPGAADALGGALNQFKAGAEEANRYINVLAAGSKFGSSAINDTSIALKNSGAVASSVGLSFEETNAAIQALAAVSIKGGEAGTGLRGVLLKLSTQSRDEFNPEIVGLQAALQNLGAANLSTAEKSKLFGQESITAATALITQADSLGELTNKLTGTSTATEQAMINTNNLDGDIKSMNSSWSQAALILGDGLNPAVRFLTQSMTTLGNYVSATIIEFGDLVDVIGTYMAVAASVVSLDIDMAKSIMEDREIRRAATEEKIADIFKVKDATDELLEKEWNAGILADKLAEEEQQRIANRDAAMKNSAELRKQEEEEKQAAIQKAIDKEIEQANAKAEREQARIDSETERDLERTQSELERLKESYMSKRELLALDLEEKQIIIDEALMNEQLTAQEHQDLMNEIAQEGAIARKKIDDFEYNEKLSMAQGALGNLANLMNSNSKEMFEVGKAAATANAIINTYSSAVKAFDSLASIPFVGPALGAAAAAAAIAGGMANVQKIQSQSFKSSGSGSPVAYSGGMPVVNTSPVASGVPGQDATQEQNPIVQQELRVVIEGDSPNSEAMRTLINNIAETMENMGGSNRLVLA